MEPLLEQLMEFDALAKRRAGVAVKEAEREVAAVPKLAAKT
jgi:hypothetical protein